MSTNDYKNVIDRICSAERVISSSLHGIILAEAYGIPATFYRDRPETYDFKYNDWYSSTNRSLHVHTLPDALMKQPDPLPDLHTMQLQLMDAFPYDLWKQ